MSKRSNPEYRLSKTFILWLLPLFISTLDAAPIPAPPSIAASGHLLLDFNSGRVLSEKNADAPLEPASLTKIMSAYVIFRELSEGNIRLDEEVVISEKAWRMPGSRMFIEVGKRVTVEQLLKGVIVQSGNDASVALAEHIAGSEETFANLMNDHARRLGMNNSNFLNSTGLPSKEHYTTARDMSTVAAATIREFPEYYTWYKIRDYTYSDIKQHNRNQLLGRDESVDGIKTGHTEAAGYCLVASGKRNDMRLISVVMGTNSVEARATASQALLNYGFRFFETHRLYGAGEKLSQVRIWKGSQEDLRLGLDKDLYVTIPRRQYKNLQAGMNVKPQIMAPVSQGRTLGNVTITLGDQTVADVPLVALESIAKGGIWQTMKDSTLLWFE